MLHFAETNALHWGEITGLSAFPVLLGSYAEVTYTDLTRVIEQILYITYSTNRARIVGLKVCAIGITQHSILNMPIHLLSYICNNDMQ
jgi:hypothetical protein